MRNFLVFNICKNIFFSFDETCFYNNDYMSARNKLATSEKPNQSGQTVIDTIDL